MKKIMRSCIFLLIMHSAIHAQKYYQERIYEPFIIGAGSAEIASIYNAPINEIFIYAYDEISGTMHIMPFQIDEKVRGYDPMNQKTKRWFYFLPDEGLVTDDGVITQHDGRFNQNDELVFMVKDMGDKAPSSIRIGDASFRQELAVCDPENNHQCAYVYIYQSSTIQDQIPHPYNFSFDTLTQTIDCSNYSVGMNTLSGIMENIKLHPPLGSDVDILDIQKLRFGGVIATSVGVFSAGPIRGVPFYENESEFLYLYDSDDVNHDNPDINMYWMKYTQDPVVRMIREVRQSITIIFDTEIFPIDSYAFYVTTKFYPNSGILEGGLSLDDSTLNALWPDAEVPPHIECDLLRQSWDFSENMVGAKFYNKHNDGVLIDGNPDDVDKTVDIVNNRIEEWTLASGPQGSFFTYFTMQDISWETRKLYYYDNKNGGNGDGTTVRSGNDTGDYKSYGDQGILLIDGNSLDFKFTAYFLPSTFTKSDAQKLAHWIGNPEPYFYYNSVKQHTHNPVQFALLQNYPNPFNQSTTVEIQMSTAEWLSLAVFDINGRRIATLADGRFQPGLHKFHWDGCDDEGVAVTSGIYFYKVQTKDYSDVKKMVLVR